MSGVTRFEIDRATWIRGKAAHDDDTRLIVSQLLTADGRRCCLGFYLAACGVPDTELLGTGEPCEVVNDRMPGWLLNISRNSTDAVLQMKANDDRDLTEDERERHVAEVFACHGVVVEFIGEGLGFPPEDEP